MNVLLDGSAAAEPETLDLLMAHCPACGSHGYPPGAHACRRCGSFLLRDVPPPQVPCLLNFVTVHAEVAPGLPVPCVVGEVRLAPGVVEEAWIDVPDEASLAPGLPLRANAQKVGATWRWSFSPLGEGSGS